MQWCGCCLLVVADEAGVVLLGRCLVSCSHDLLQEVDIARPQPSRRSALGVGGLVQVGLKRLGQPLATRPMRTLLHQNG